VTGAHIHIEGGSSILELRTKHVVVTGTHIHGFSVKNRDKITTRPNELASTILEEELRRLKRLKPTDLTTRFS
jgi:hypothetical protein